MEYKKCEYGSYVHNCIIVRRDGDSSDVLFYQDVDKSIRPFLNGYAIIPIAKYFELQNERGEDGNDWPEDMQKQIEEADKQLHPEK